MSSSSESKSHIFYQAFQGVNVSLVVHGERYTYSALANSLRQEKDDIYQSEWIGWQHSQSFRVPEQGANFGTQWNSSE
jgi:hypothetical protein